MGTNHKYKVLELAHRIAWRYKKSSDPAHSDTFTFNESTLLQFVGALAQQAVPPDARDGINGQFNACMYREHCRSMLAAAPSAPQCTRSHPHEDMGAACQRKTEEARAASAARQAVPEGHIAVPVRVLKDASNALGNFVSDHGWSDADMQAMDNLDAYLAPPSVQSMLAAAPAAPVAPKAGQSPAVAHAPLTDEQVRRGFRELDAADPVRLMSAWQIWSKATDWAQHQFGIDPHATEPKPPAHPNGEALAAPQAEQQAAQLRAEVQRLKFELQNSREAWVALSEHAKNLQAALAAQQAEREPIDMVLHCPKCGMQHIDAPEWVDDPHDIEQGRMLGWKNEPHRSHLCHGCGHVWRPADVATNGVQAVKTKGKADSPVMQQAERKPLTDEQIEVLRKQDDCGEDAPEFARIIRIAERDLADRWGVKLGDIGKEGA